MSKIMLDVDTDIDGHIIDKDVNNNDNDDKSLSIKIEKLKYKRYTEEQEKQLREMYSSVIVQDYNDDYNLSEEEKEEKNKCYKAFTLHNRCKRKYKNIIEYVKAVRLALNFIYIVSVNNGDLINRGDFIKNVLNGDIKIVGLNLPKYIGKDRKKINWDFVNEVILNEEADINDLLKDPHSEMEVIDISDDVIDKIESSFDNKPNKDKMYVLSSSNKDNKRFIKENDDIVKYIIDNDNYNKKIKSRANALNAYVFNLSEDDFAYLSKKDAKRGFKYKNNEPKFKGSYLDYKAYKKYCQKLEDYEYTHKKVNFEGKMKTQEEIDEININRLLEENDYNLRIMGDNPRRLKKKAKKDKALRNKVKAAKANLLKYQKKLGKKKSKKKKG